MYVSVYPFCVRPPLWRLKGRSYLDMVPRLNDWSGAGVGGVALSQAGLGGGTQGDPTSPRGHSR